MKCQSDTCTLTSYKGKKKKFVTVLSSLHETVFFEGAKRKRTTVIDYNHTKYGVDIVDAMACLYTTKVASLASAGDCLWKCLCTNIQVLVDHVGFLQPS